MYRGVFGFNNCRLGGSRKLNLNVASFVSGERKRGRTFTRWFFGPEEGDYKSVTVIFLKIEYCRFKE